MQNAESQTQNRNKHDGNFKRQNMLLLGYSGLLL